jgi:hypothetical protein
MDIGKTYKSQTSFVVQKAKTLPYGEFEAVIATESLDRHNEHVSVKGMKIPRKNYKIYWNHLTDGMNLPIGKWLKVWKKDNKIYGHGKLAVDKYDFAKTVYDLMSADEQYIDSTSVSFMPEELDTDTMTWTKSEFVEASLVGEPANTEALVLAKNFKEQEQEFITQATNDNDTELEQSVTELKKRMDAVEDAYITSTDEPSIKQIIRLRMAVKEVDKTAEKLNRVIKIKLKET